MKLYLAGPFAPQEDWRYLVTNGLAEKADDSGACPLHEHICPVRLSASVFGVCDYVGPSFRSCRHGCFDSSLPLFIAHSSERSRAIHLLFQEVLSADVVYAWLPDPAVDAITAFVIAMACAYRKNLWVGALRPQLGHWLAYDLADAVGFADPVCVDPPPVHVLRRLINEHYPAHCHVMPYEDYLRTTVWERLRAQAIQEAGSRCQVCNDSVPLQVHHRTYERRGFEQTSDLIALCRRCHGTFHLDHPKATPAMRGPDVRSWKYASIIRYFSKTPAFRRAHPEEHHYSKPPVSLDFTSCLHSPAADSPSPAITDSAPTAGRTSDGQASPSPISSSTAKSLFEF